ncbi:MAG: cytochrome c [Bacteroidia bacterium]|nr:cytochrome c [Bacteroidia bacterium]
MLVVVSCSDAQLGSLEQLAKGASLYHTNCSNCHQKDGSGLEGLIPPLAATDYLPANKNDLPCIIQNGLSGDIIVNGKKYKLAMPANKSLSNKDIANITAYIYKKFLKEDEFFSDTAMSIKLKNCVKKLS